MITENDKYGYKAFPRDAFSVNFVLVDVVLGVSADQLWIPR